MYQPIRCWFKKLKSETGIVQHPHEAYKQKKWDENIPTSIYKSKLTKHEHNHKQVNTNYTLSCIPHSLRKFT